MESISSFTIPPIPNQDSKIGQLQTAAKNVGKNLQNAEAHLLNLYAAYNNGTEIEVDGKTKKVSEEDIQVATMKYQKAQGILEMFTTMLKNIHEQIMSGIRKLAN